MVSWQGATWSGTVLLRSSITTPSRHLCLSSIISLSHPLLSASPPCHVLKPPKFSFFITTHSRYSQNMKHGHTLKYKQTKTRLVITDLERPLSHIHTEPDTHTHTHTFNLNHHCTRVRPNTPLLIDLCLFMAFRLLNPSILSSLSLSLLFLALSLSLPVISDWSCDATSLSHPACVLACFISLLYLTDCNHLVFLSYSQLFF